MYTNETTLIGFIRPPASLPRILEFDGHKISCIETVIVTGQNSALHIPIFITGEARKTAQEWFEVFPEGFHARTQSTVMMLDGVPCLVVNFIQAREDKRWQIFE